MKIMLGSSNSYYVASYVGSDDKLYLGLED